MQFRLLEEATHLQQTQEIGECRFGTFVFVVAVGVQAVATAAGLRVVDDAPADAMLQERHALAAIGCVLLLAADSGTFLRSWVFWIKMALVGLLVANGLFVAAVAWDRLNEKPEIQARITELLNRLGLDASTTGTRARRAAGTANTLA